MRRNVQMHWTWIVVVLLVLLGGVRWELRDAVALTPATSMAVGTSAMTATTPELAAFDEQQASNELEAQLVAIYELASPSVVKVTNRSYVYYRSFIDEAIQTDAAIRSGNSGGPLLDLQGRVIGVNSQIISPSGASSGIGLAVSSSTVQRVVPELIAQGYYAHPWLGADMVPLTSSVARVLSEAGVDVSSQSGLLVLDVTSGGPADEAGIQGGSRWVRLGHYQFPVGGDVITAIDGQLTADLETLTVYLETETAIGGTVNLTIQRGDQELTIPVTLEEQPRE